MNDNFLKSRIELIPIIYNFKDNLDELVFKLNIKSNMPTKNLSKDLVASNNKIYFDKEIIKLFKNNEELIFKLN